MKSFLKDLNYIIHYYGKAVKVEEKFGDRGFTFTNDIRIYEYGNIWHAIDISLPWAVSPLRCERIVDFLEFYLYND